MGRGASFENGLAVRFKLQAPTRHGNTPDDDDLAGWLTLMQHYRLPTRLLDWTEAVLIAAYFATCDAKHGDSPGAIWFLCPSKLNEVATAEDGRVLTMKNPRVRPLIAEALSFERNSKDTLAVMPRECDPRMLVQQARFTIHGTEVPLDERPDADRYLRKLVIEPAVKDKLRASIELLGIRKSMLFPDLESLAADLCEHYQPIALPRLEPTSKPPDRTPISVVWLPPSGDPGFAVPASQLSLPGANGAQNEQSKGAGQAIIPAPESTGTPPDARPAGEARRA